MAHTAKQAFYENLSGSTVGEVNALTGLVVLGHALYTYLHRIGFLRHQDVLPAFVLYIFLPLLAYTLYADAKTLLAGLLAIFGGATWALRHSAHRDLRSHSRERPYPSPSTPDVRTTRTRVPFVTAYRAIMMISTVICILAVDLPIFPRRFAKTETFGVSLMDLGVGSFVFSSAVVASPKAQTLLRRKAGFGLDVWVAALRDQGVLLALGVVRMVLVWRSGYHEHVTEYGVHWNFFVTLALLAPLLPVAVSVKRALRVPFLVQAAILATVYQVALTKGGLQSYVLFAPRPLGDLVRQNREGLLSFVGYGAIYLLGLDAGDIVLCTTRRRPVISLLLVTATCHWTAYLASTSLPLFGRHTPTLQVSRRMANLPYVALTAAHNAGLLCALAVVQKFVAKESVSKSLSTSHHAPRGSLKALLGKQKAAAVETGRPQRKSARQDKLKVEATSGTESDPPSTPTPASRSTSTSTGDSVSRLLQRYNAKGLQVFLVANLLTGGVNLLMGDDMPTTEKWTGFGVMVFYVVVVSVVAYVA